VRASGSLCNARAEAEFSIVGDRQGVVVVVRRNHRRDGPKISAREMRIELSTSGSRADTISKPGRPFRPFAAGRQFGSIALANRDVGKILLELGRVDHRSDVRPRPEVFVDDEAVHRCPGAK
jgi:hypothetical protein